MTIKQTLCAVAVALAGCGGGGGGGGDEVQPATIGPLSKYAGTYSYCDRNEMLRMTVNVLDDGQAATIRQHSEYYQLAGCAGPVVGVESAVDVTARYLRTGPATVTGYPASNSVTTHTVDRIHISAPQTVISLTGSGVSTINGQTCVSYTGGRTCLVSLTVGGELDGGMFFTDLALVTLVATAAGYERDLAFPR